MGNAKTTERKEYLDWLLTPPGEREPSTKAAWAAEHGVVVSTMWKWEESPEFQEELRKLKGKWGVRFQGEILGRLMKIVSEGSDTAAIQAAKVLLPHLDTGVKEASEEEVTSEQLAAIRKALTEQGYTVINGK